MPVRCAILFPIRGVERQRVELRDPKAPTCRWPACAFRVGVEAPQPEDASSFPPAARPFVKLARPHPKAPRESQLTRQGVPPSIQRMRAVPYVACLGLSGDATVGRGGRADARRALHT